MLEEWYPIIAVMYGTGGFLFGLYLWWRTQKRIERTSGAISTQVKAAVIDLSGRVDSGMSKFDNALGALDSRITAISDPEGINIAQEVESALNERLEAFSNELPSTIGEHVYQAIQQVKAQETKALQAQLEAMGLDEGIEKMGKEAQELMLSQMTVGQQAAYQIANLKPSKKWMKDHPFGSAAWEMTKAQQMQILAAIQEGVLGQTNNAASAPNSAEPASRGFGVR